MLHEPLQVKQYHQPVMDVQREEDPEKFKGGAIFLVKGFKTEKQRIKEHLEQNQFLDLQPNTHQSQYHHRDLGKDINPRMYFKHRTTLERVQEAAIYPNVLNNQQENMKSFLPEEGDETRCRLVSRGPEVRVQEPVRKGKGLTGKDIFPSLHRKTHFKAVSSIMARAPQNSLVSAHISAPASRDISPMPSVEHVLKQGNFKEEEAAYLAKEVLYGCHMLSTCQSKGFLKSGSGKLVSNPENSIGEVYSRLPSKIRRTASVRENVRSAYGY